MSADVGYVEVTERSDACALAVSQGARSLCATGLHVRVHGWCPPDASLFNFWGALYGDLAHREPQYKLVPDLRPDSGVRALRCALLGLRAVSDMLIPFRLPHDA